MSSEPQPVSPEPAPAELPPPPAQPPPLAKAKPGESRWQVIGVFLLMVVVIQLTMGSKIRLSQWGVSADGNVANDNAAVYEGLSWMNGRLDLPYAGDTSKEYNRPHDSAYYEGKVYNVFPPMLPALTVALSPIHETWLGLPAGMWSPQTYALFFYWPIPIVAFCVFRRRCEDSIWAAVLTIAFMGGTAVLPSLHKGQTGMLGDIYHAISQVGMLIVAADIVGRQRTWPGLIGLAISVWTRQLTFLYGLPLLFVAYRRGGWKTFTWCGLGLVVIAAPLLALNQAKFGHPLDFGYRHIYVGRDDPHDVSQKCREHGTFSTVFLRENTYQMFVKMPQIDLEKLSLTEWPVSDSSNKGTALWMTTPLVLWILLGCRQWWREPGAPVLFATSLLILAWILCYHGTSYISQGYARYVLDYLPVWFVIIAPHTRGGWRTAFSLACVAWSALYFQAIVPDMPRGERIMVVENASV